MIYILNGLKWNTKDSNFFIKKQGRGWQRITLKELSKMLEMSPKEIRENFKNYGKRA